MKSFRIVLVPLSVEVFGLLSLSAHAAPRDDVMSRALRCAVIGESRSWLDCYYGAAQPARDALGLQPAPPSQLTLVQSPQTASGPPQNVNVRGQVLSNAFRCTGPIDDHQWLNCYYAAAQPMRAVLGLPPAPQTGITISGDEFGLATRHKPNIEKRADHIESRMMSYTYDKYGIFYSGLGQWSGLEASARGYELCVLEEASRKLHSTHQPRLLRELQFRGAE